MTEKMTEKWQCDICGKVFPGRKGAEHCEERHLADQKRIAAWREAQAQGRPFWGRYLKGETGEPTLWMIVHVSVSVTPDGEAKPCMTTCRNANQRWVLPIPSDHDRYLTPEEVVEAGWCPFGSRIYQNHVPLAVREQVADAFLALPEQRQMTILKEKKTFSD